MVTRTVAASLAEARQLLLRRPLFVAEDVVFLDQVAQGPRRDPEQLTGPAAIARGCGEGLPEELQLLGFQVIVEAEAVSQRDGRGGAGGMDRGRKPLRQDRRRDLEGDGALDRVLELAHVARP